MTFWDAVVALFELIVFALQGIFALAVILGICIGIGNFLSWCDDTFGGSRAYTPQPIPEQRRDSSMSDSSWQPALSANNAPLQMAKEEYYENGRVKAREVRYDTSKVEPGPMIPDQPSGGSGSIAGNNRRQVGPTRGNGLQETAAPLVMDAFRDPECDSVELQGLAYGAEETLRNQMGPGFVVLSMLAYKEDGTDAQGRVKIIRHPQQDQLFTGIEHDGNIVLDPLAFPDMITEAEAEWDRRIERQGNIHQVFMWRKP